MRNALIVLSLALAGACTTPKERARDIHDELVYFKDYRVGVCYAHWSYDGDAKSGLLAAVPCEKVAHLLVNGAEAAR